MGQWQSNLRASASEESKWVQGPSATQLNPVKTHISNHHRNQVWRHGLLCPQGTNLWSNSLQGTETVSDYLLWLKRRQHSNFSTHPQKLQPWNTWSCSPAILSSRGGEGKHRLNTQSRAFIVGGGGFMVWKKTFSTCCPRNRRSSMSLEVNTGVLAADHRPRGELCV